MDTSTPQEPVPARRGVSGYGVAIVVTAAAVLVRRLIDPWLGDSLPFATVFGAVAAAVWYGGYRPALLATAAGFLACSYLFVEPRGSARPHGAGQWVGLAAYLFSCGLIVAFGEALHVARRHAEAQRWQREREAADRREAERQLAATLESITDGFLRLDREWRVVYANAEAERINQRPRSEMLGRTHWELWPDTVGTALEAEYRRAVAEQVTVEFENYYAPWDRWYAIKADPAPDGGLVVFFHDVTAHKRAEAAVEAERRRVQVMADGVPALISYVDADGRYRLNNRAYETWFGHPRGEIVGRSMRDVLGEAAWAAIRPHVEAALAGTAVSYESQVPYKDGGTRWVSCDYTPDFGDDGRVRGFVAHVVDVTARKRAEQAAREGERRLDLVLGSINDHLVSYDRHWRYTYVNDRAAAVLGRSRDELLGRCIWELFPDAVGNQYHAELHRALADQQVIRSEHYYAPFDAWFENHIYPSPDGVTVFASDVTWRKRADERLRRSAELLTFLIDRSPTGFYIVDADFRISHINADSQARAFRNVSPAVGRRLDEAMRILWPEPLATEIIALFRRTLDTGEPYRSPGLVSPRRDLDAVETYEWQLDRIVLPDGTRGVVCYYYDTTRLRETERQLRASEETLERQAEELKEADRRKDEFLATLAHELRNPLAPIRNGLQIIRLAGANGTVEHARTMMERQLAQLVRLVDDLLDVSRITRGKLELRKERVEVRAVIASAVEAARPLIEQAGHDLAVAVPDEPIVVDGDPTRLSQVVSNLLNNSAKYTNRGGRVRLAVGRDGDAAVVSVADDGIGVPPAMLGRVFDMFTQVDRTLEKTTGGLGIGLSLVKGLVEAHGGTVEARSEGEGKGSEFVVRLPVATPADADHAGRPTDEVAPTGRRVLVVDDNEDAADSLGQLLELLGNEVCTAHDGAAGVERAGAFRPDVVLMDIGMPKLNGYDAARRIREQPWGRAMVLVALTGWGQEDDRRKSADAGFDFHLVKPVDPAALGKLLAGLDAAAV